MFQGFGFIGETIIKGPEVITFQDILVEYQLRYYLIMRATRFGYNYIEITVPGNAPTKISPIRGNLQVLNKLFSTVLGKYNP